MGAWIEGDEDGYSFPFNHDAQDDAKMGPRLCLLILWALFARSFFFFAGAGARWLFSSSSPGGLSW